MTGSSGHRLKHYRCVVLWQKLLLRISLPTFPPLTPENARKDRPKKPKEAKK